MKTIGPLLFEYDTERNELHISKGEEAVGMIECFTHNDWLAFTYAAKDVQNDGRQ